MDALADPLAFRSESGSNPKARWFRRQRKQLLIGAVAIGLTGAAVWFGWQWWTIGRFIESTDDAYVGGEVTAIAPKVAGLIATVAVTDNQRVKAGDLLVKLDDRDFRAKLARAEATVETRKAMLANLAAERNLQEAMIEQASAEIAAATAEVARSKYDVDRYRALSTEKFASAQRFEQADAHYKQALAGERKARAAKLAAQREVDVIDSQSRQAAAELDQAMADRDLAALDLAYTEIRAPIDGVVGNRAARVGAYAMVGAQLLSIVPAHGLWVDANFKESQLAHMAAGQPVEVTADVLPGMRFRGHVASLAPATGAQFSVIPPENATGNFTKIVQRVPVRILLDGEAAELGRLRPGLSVVAEVDQRPDAAMRLAKQ
jgi:membrane fusion protein (multidrug efflux system)